MSKPIGIAIHGGAGTILKSELSKEQEKAYKSTLEKSFRRGYEILENGGSSLESVEEAVRILEDSHLFNAGKGSVFNAEGLHDMDASIMRGDNLEAGAVCQVGGVKNPIKLARAIMENSDHVFLSGQGALDFAKQFNIQMESNEYFYDEFRFKQWQSVKGTNKTQLDHSPLDEKKFGTVGAVALDKHGNVAAATSTGGMTNKRYGRIGDSPIIGSGTYADNKTCAVSCTGSGEFFIRNVTAFRVAALMEYKGLTLQDASIQVVLKDLPELGGDGGLVAIDSHANVSLIFNTEGMYRGYKTSGLGEQVMIYS